MDEILALEAEALKITTETHLKNRDKYKKMYIKYAIDSDMDTNLNLDEMNTPKLRRLLKIFNIKLN